MKRTQIQLTDKLYNQLKLIGRYREWTLAEILRQGAEYIVRIYGVPHLGNASDWRPPEPKKLGAIKISSERLRQAANERE